MTVRTTASQEGNDAFTGVDTFKQLNEIRFADQFSGADMGAKITAAIADLPATGGIVDATAFQGTQTAAATINLSKKVVLKLASVTLQLSGSPGINLSAQGAMIMGGGPTVTILQANSGTADVVQTNAGNCVMRDFSINSAVARTGGAGIQCKSDTGLFENFTIDKTYYGIQIADSAGDLNYFRNFIMGQQASPAGSWNVGIQIGPITTGTISGCFFENGVIESTSAFTTGMIILDSGCDTIHFTNCQAVANVGGSDAFSVGIKNTSTAQDPSYTCFTNCDFEAGTTKDAVTITAGLLTAFVNCNVISSRVCFNVQGGKGLRVSDSSIGNAQQNAFLVSGGTDLRILNNRIWDTSLATDGGYNSIDIAAAITDFSVLHNDFTTANAVTNHPAYNVSIATGASNRYWIMGNTPGTTTTGFLHDLGTGTTKAIAWNDRTISLAGSTSGTTTVQASATASGTLTLPAATDTLVGKATTDNLSNKTLTQASSANSVTLLNAQGVTAALTGNSTDQVVYTYTLPAGTLAAGKGVRVTVAWAHGTGTASVAYKLQFGATSIVNPSSAVTGSFYATGIVVNNPSSTTAQRASGTVLSSSTVVQATAGNAPAENTANAIVIQFTFNVANTDQVTGGQFLVELIQ